MLLRGKNPHTFQRLDVLFVDGRVVAVGPAEAGPADREAEWLAPALFDLQINGCLGVSFTDPALTTEKVRVAVAECRRHGIGAFLPTLITSAADGLERAFAALERACREDADIAKAVPGYHLEGPFIAADDGPRGAHPRAHVRPPDPGLFRRWNAAAAGRIRLVTLAPELPGRSR